MALFTGIACAVFFFLHMLDQTGGFNLLPRDLEDIAALGAALFGIIFGFSVALSVTLSLYQLASK